MSVERIAGRYAKSLLDLTQELGRTPEVLSDMNGIQELLKNRELYLLFKSPIVKSGAKAKIVDKIFTGKVSDTTLKFLQLVVKKGREAFLPEISNEYVRQYKSLQKISDVTLITAAAVDQKFVDGIKATLLSSDKTGDSIDLKTEVDPSLIGGYIIKIGDRLLDQSVKAQLDAIKKNYVTA